MGELSEDTAKILAFLQIAPDVDPAIAVFVHIIKCVQAMSELNTSSPKVQNFSSTKVIRKRLLEDFTIFFWHFLIDAFSFNIRDDRQKHTAVQYLDCSLAILQNIPSVLSVTKDRDRKLLHNESIYSVTDGTVTFESLKMLFRFHQAAAFETDSDGSMPLHYLAKTDNYESDHQATVQKLIEVHKEAASTKVRGRC